jgi:hypothetical protein
VIIIKAEYELILSLLFFAGFEVLARPDKPSKKASTA